MKSWVAGGGGILMLGGASLAECSQVRAGAELATALPVECLNTEDLIESSAGFTAEVVMPDHPAIKSLPRHSFPPIFGYNEVKAKPGSQCGA